MRMLEQANRFITIGKRRIGRGHPCFIIAEAGVNHNGDLTLAKELIDAAAQAGADAVKFQNFTAASLVSRGAPKADYQKATTPGRESQFEMIRKLELSEDMTRALFEYAAQKRILFLSTGFDERSVNVLDRIGVPAFKIGSGDITDIPLLQHIGSKRKPVILSTGMSYLEEVESAISSIEEAGCSELALLHCVSSYPANPESANLRALTTLEKTFTRPVGFSDHSLGFEVAVAAIALGACILEKHITLDNQLPGPDHKVSLTPHRFQDLIRALRVVEAAMGDGGKHPSASELEIRDVARKSIVASCDIPPGTLITRQMLAFKRPGTGIAPGQWGRLVGKTANRLIIQDTLIGEADFG